jgi:hypothetical protein
MALIGVISLSYFDTEEWQELSRLQQESQEAFAREAEKAWDSLDYQTQLRVFYAVIKRLYQGEVKDKGTYRYILYDVFGFGPESYAIGMECGLMALHNAYVDIDEFEALRKENRELRNKLATEK